MNPKPFGSAAVRRPLTLVATLLVVAATGNALLAGCGGGNKTEQTNQNQTTTTTPPATTESTSTSGEVAAVNADSIFKTTCATCHGPSGHGDGPGAVALNPKPRNYHDKAYMSTRTDEDLYNSIFNGKSQMPAWGKNGILKPDQIHAMVAYVRKLSEQP